MYRFSHKGVLCVYKICLLQRAAATFFLVLFDSMNIVRTRAYAPYRNTKAALCVCVQIMPVNSNVNFYRFGPGLLLSLALATTITTATAISDCSVDGAGAASPCCNMATTFSSITDLNYRNAQTQVAICTLDNTCVLCGRKSASDTQLAAQYQASYNTFLAFFEQNQCWGGEIARSPGTTVAPLEERNDYATNMACGKCSVANFTSPCVSVGTCTNAGFTMNWSLFSIVVEALAIVALLYAWCRARKTQSPFQPLHPSYQTSTASYHS